LILSVKVSRFIKQTVNSTRTGAISSGQREQGTGLPHHPRPDRFRRVGREIFWVAAGQAIAILGALVGVRLLTGLLPPNVYGDLALGMTLATLVNQIVMGPIANAASRFFSPAREANELASFLTALRRLLVKGTVVVLLLAGSISLVLLLKGQFDWLWLGVAAFSCALLSGYNSALDSIQNAARQRPIVAWHQALSSWGRFLAAAGLVLWLGPTSAVAMLGYVLATLLVLLSQFLLFRRTLRATENIRGEEVLPHQCWDTQMFTYAWPFATWGILTWAQMASDRWGLQVFGSNQDVGLYAALYQIGYAPVSIAAGLMAQLVAPVIFQRAGDASNPARMEQVNMTNRLLTLGALGLTAVVFVTAAVFHDLVFRIFVAPAYASVAYLLPWMTLAGGLFAAGQAASLNLMSSLATKALLMPKIGTGVLGVGLNCLGAALFGIPGVVAASIIFAAVYLVWILAITRSSAVPFRASTQ
jgi:O-antigen/teichoic acid export membrane protein